MQSYVWPDMIQLNDDGVDDRPIDKQMDSMQDEWAAFTQQVTSSKEAVEELPEVVS